MLAVLSYADSGFGVYIRVSDMHACSSRAGKRREQLSRVESTASQPMKRLLFAADNLISLHPSLMDLPKSIGLRLFRALAMAEVEPDPQREILQWEGIGWKATFIPITVKPHAYFKDAAAEGALSYLTWGHGTDWKALPYILHERLVRPQSWEKGSLPSSGFFSLKLSIKNGLTTPSSTVCAERWPSPRTVELPYSNLYRTLLAKDLSWEPLEESVWYISYGMPCKEPYGTYLFI